MNKYFIPHSFKKNTVIPSSLSAIQQKRQKTQVSLKNKKLYPQVNYVSLKNAKLKAKSFQKDKPNRKTLGKSLNKSPTRSKIKSRNTSHVSL